MACFEKLTDRIYRLKVPFENIYTAVFLISHCGGYAIVDCATTEQDADIILDAVDRLGIGRGEITHILITHAHGDHVGGLRYLLPHLPEAVVCACSGDIAERLSIPRFVLLSDGQTVADGICALSLAGHSTDSIGYLDTESATLISGDAVQLCGVGRYGCGLGDFAAYLHTLDRIDRMELSRLIASHDYYPHGSVADGVEEIGRYIADSRAYAEYIMRVCETCTKNKITDKNTVCDLIRAKNAESDANIPPLQYSTVGNCLKKYV